jgi:hypothetical protein
MSLKKNLTHRERHHLIYRASRQIADYFLNVQHRGELLTFNDCVDLHITHELRPLRSLITERALRAIHNWQAKATADANAKQGPKKWVFIGGYARGEGEFHCVRCGERCAPELPIDVSELIAMGENFLRMHLACPSSGASR